MKAVLHRVMWIKMRKVRKAASVENTSVEPIMAKAELDWWIKVIHRLRAVDLICKPLLTADVEKTRKSGG